MAQQNQGNPASGGASNTSPAATPQTRDNPGQAGAAQTGKSGPTTGAQQGSNPRDTSRLGPDSGNARGNDIGPARKGDSTNATDAIDLEDETLEKRPAGAGAEVVIPKTGDLSDSKKASKM